METNTNVIGNEAEVENENQAASVVEEVRVCVEPKYMKVYEGWSKVSPGLPRELDGFTKSKTFELTQLLDNHSRFVPLVVDLKQGRYVCYSALGVMKESGTDLVLATVTQGSEAKALEEHIDEAMRLVKQCAKVGRFSGVFG